MVISMGICPRCGSWVDEGEPYCPECCYMGGSDDENEEEDVITIDGREYDRRDVERVLDDFNYTLEDLERNLIDDDDLDDIIDELF